MNTVSSQILYQLQYIKHFKQRKKRYQSFISITKCLPFHFESKSSQPLSHKSILDVIPSGWWWYRVVCWDIWIEFTIPFILFVKCFCFFPLPFTTQILCRHRKLRSLNVIFEWEPLGAPRILKRITWYSYTHKFTILINKKQQQRLWKFYHPSNALF